MIDFEMVKAYFLKNQLNKFELMVINMLVLIITKENLYLNRKANLKKKSRTC